MSEEFPSVVQCHLFHQCPLRSKLLGSDCHDLGGVFVLYVLKALRKTQFK